MISNSPSGSAYACLSGTCERQMSVNLQRLPFLEYTASKFVPGLLARTYKTLTSAPVSGAIKQGKLHNELYPFLVHRVN